VTNLSYPPLRIGYTEISGKIETQRDQAEEEDSQKRSWGQFWWEQAA
jgi:hypothetical protein